MTILKPDHLLEQAERLIQPSLSGAPRQADLRRAVSGSYYAAFHTITAAVADMFVGSTFKREARYRLAYRSVDHGRLRRLCLDAQKPVMPTKYRDYLDAPNLGDDLAALATAFVDLQDRRHAADYDPAYRVTRDEASSLVRLARTAIVRFQTADTRNRETFLALLTFPPRTSESA